MMLQSNRGMGQVPLVGSMLDAVPQSPANVDPLNIQFPAYCNWPIFGSLTEIFGSQCTPPTPVQMTAMQQAQLSQVAAVNPNLAAQGVAAGNAASAALASSDPSGAAAYNASINDPLSSALFGTNAANYLTGVNPNTNQPGTNWMIVGIAAAAVFLMAIAKK